MDLTSLLAVLILLSVVAYFMGLKKSQAIAKKGNGITSLHSLPSYYGTMVATWCLLPALLLLAVWQFSEQNVLQSMTLDSAIISDVPEDAVQRSLLINTIENISSGGLQSDNLEHVAAADYLNDLRLTSQT